MNKISTYIRESYSELTTKVTWPTWPELQASSIVVAVASLIIAIVVFGMDKVSSMVLTAFYKSF